MVENRLTPHMPIAYSVGRAMEESSNENGPHRPEEKATEVKKKKAKDAWDKVNEKRKKKGSKISHEEKEAQKVQIEKGKLPILLKFFLSDREQIEVAKETPKDPKPKEFIEEIVEYKKKGAITNKYKEEISRAVSKLESDDDITYEDAQRIRKNLEEDALFPKEDRPILAEAADGTDGGDREPPAPPSQPTPESEEPREGENDIDRANRIYKAELERLKQEGGGGLESTPDSIHGVAEWIAKREGNRWARGGEHELINEAGDFVKENFLIWIRERILHLHEQDLNNPQMNLLVSVGISTQYRPISIIEMINNPNQFFRDKNTGEVFTEFADQCLDEVYLFGKNRNNEVLYRLAMGSDEELPKVLTEIHKTNDFINSTNLRKIMTLPDNFETGDMKVGDTTRKAYEIYYYASDYDQLRKILGDNSPFFEKKTFENAANFIEKKGKGEPISDEHKRIINKMFKDDGEPSIKEFIQVINPYNEPEKTGSHLELTREAIRQTLAERYVLDDGMDIADSIERKSARINLSYAEWWAYAMALWTGAGARADTGTIGYNALTKTEGVQAYRERQSEAKRAGPVGNEYDIAVIKSLSMDFFNGIEVEKHWDEEKQEEVRETPFEIFLELDQKGKSLDERKKIADKLKFRQNTQVSYSSNHINRAFQVFQGMTGAQELKLEEIVKFEPFRGVVFDRGKFEEQVNENFLKPMRYVYSTYSQIDYSKPTRIINRKATAREGRPVYKDVTVAEKMFGPDVLEGFYKKDGKIDEEKLQEDGVSTILWKNAARARIAAHIKSHRQLGSGYVPFNMAMIEQLYQALETIQEIDVTDDEGGFTRGEKFFSKEDIKWIRKKSGTTVGSMFLKEVVGKSGGKGAALGAWDAAKIFFQNIFS